MSQLCHRRRCSPLTIKKKKKLAIWGHAVLRALSAVRTFASTVHIRSDEPPKPPCPIVNSTSALDYKTSHQVWPPPLPKMDLPRSQSTEEAVTDILYNMSLPSLQPYEK
jgi:acetolactate synthase-1/3 small subunit